MHACGLISAIDPTIALVTLIRTVVRTICKIFDQQLDLMIASFNKGP